MLLAAGMAITEHHKRGQGWGLQQIRIFSKFLLSSSESPIPGLQTAVFQPSGHMACPWCMWGGHALFLFPPVKATNSIRLGPPPVTCLNSVTS